MYQEIHHTLKLSDANQYEPKATAKLCTCNKCHKNTYDICFYVPFSTIFVCLGTIQIISGVFYFMKIPVTKLIFTISIGCWAILCGISGSLVACACPSTPRKHEFLLYCSISVLILNVINLVLLEIGQVREIFNDHLQKVLSKEYSLIEPENGRFITTYSAILLILVAFVEAQINFCFLSRSQTKHKKEAFPRKTRRPQQYVDSDQNADLEYVIPKKMETNGSRKPSMDTTVQVYAKSWVFEGTGEEAYNQPDDSCSASICSSSSPTRLNMLGNKSDSHKNGHSSKLSDANSERFNHPLSSFSRCATPSPIPNSGKATPTNIVYAEYSYHDPRIPKANRLTVDYVQSIDPTIAPDATVVTPKLTLASTSAAPKYPPKSNNNNNNNQNSNGPSSMSSQQDDSQYASMLAELEQSLIEKKIQTTNMSPDDTSLSTDKFGSSKSSSKDLEFSKELEAALQLIQDLETPSEGPADGIQSAITPKVNRSDSEKTLSAAISLPSPEQGPYKLQTPEAQTPQNGKHNDDYKKTNIIHIETSSQSTSTSGYSSPNSFSSNATQCPPSTNGGTGPNTIHDNIFTGDKSNVVRIYIGNDTSNNTSNTKTRLKTHKKPLIKDRGQINLNHIEGQFNDTSNKPQSLFKKLSKVNQVNHLSDFQNRVFKPDCLAYLTEEELIMRHKCNRDVIRKIERNVAQKLRGSPRYRDDLA